MAIYTDTLSKSNGTETTAFPHEPEGDIYPYYDKKVESAWSIPSWDDSGDYLGGVESTFTDGFDPDAGDWNLEGFAMSNATYLKFKGFHETNPPNNTFLFYKHRITTTYLVEIKKFKGTWNKEFQWWEYEMTLKNKGVVT
jgi:hypothetical protein